MQVATDTRLWLLNALKQTRQYLADLIKAAAARSESEVRAHSSHTRSHGAPLQAQAISEATLGLPGSIELSRAGHPWHSLPAQSCAQRRCY